ncbi:MAG: hypothetical protein MPJ08_00945 [Nitrosopumilus sp.]|nr:hypothetical protein [Nitrosopumilus sp.]
MGRTYGIKDACDQAILHKRLCKGKITQDEYRAESCRCAINWLQSHAMEINGMGKFLKILQRNKKIGHLVHAQFLIDILKAGYDVVEVEKTDGVYDIDIQLEQCNIQVWHGQTPTSFRVESCQAHITELGGVETFPAEDNRKIREKLEQLPSDKLGILVTFLKTPFDLLDPAFTLSKYINNPKCIVTVIRKSTGDSTYLSAIVCVPKDFKHLEYVADLLTRLGWEYMIWSIPCD